MDKILETKNIANF